MALYPFQQRGLDQTEQFSRVAYYYDMGLGKTFVGGEKARILNANVLLVVCQKSKVQDWVDHFVQQDFESLYGMIYDCTAWDKRDWAAFAENPNQRCVLVVNYDLTFRRPAFLKLENFTLLLDESSQIQNEKAKRTKFILKMNPLNVILLSGTPTSGKYENLWAQLNLLGWSISKELYNRQYVNWVKVETDGFIHYVIDKEEPYKNVDRLKQKMRDYGSVFLKTEECFDLPEQIFIPLTVPKTKEYIQFRKKGLVTIEGTELVGDSTLTKRLYSRMLCGHYNKEKLQAFKDLASSTKDRLIVFYNFNAELNALQRIAAELERPVSQVNGHVKDLLAYENEEDSITLVQYQAGAKGLNLQKANKVVYFTPTEKCEDWMQSQKRIHRIGQEKPCFYYQMICKNSVEERIYEALAKGIDYTNYLFEEGDV